MKTQDDIEEDISALFESILERMNEKRQDKDRYVILDKEKIIAIKEYVKDHPHDYVVFGDDWWNLTLSNTILLY